MKAFIVILIGLVLLYDTDAQGQNGTTAVGPCPAVDPEAAKAISSTTKVTLLVTNTLSYPIRFIWINFAGEEAYTQQISEGEQVPVYTYATHSWVAKAYTVARLEINGSCVFTTEYNNNASVYLSISDSENNPGAPETVEQMTCPPIEAGLLKSNTSKTPKKVYFSNDATETAQIQWIGMDGKVGYYADIKPGVTIFIYTYVSHVWIAVRTSDFSRLAIGSSCSFKVIDGYYTQYVSITNPVKRECPRMSKDIAAKQSQMQVTLNVKNEKTEAIRMLWINFEGDVAWFFQINAGEERIINTFATHPFIAATLSGQREAINGACYYVTPASAGEQSLVIKGEKASLCQELDGTIKTGDTPSGGNNVRLYFENQALMDVVIQYIDTNGDVTSFKQFVREGDTSYVTTKRNSTFIVRADHDDTKLFIDNKCSITVDVNAGTVNTVVTAYNTNEAICPSVSEITERPTETDSERSLDVTNHARKTVKLYAVSSDGTTILIKSIESGYTRDVTVNKGDPIIAMVENTNMRIKLNDKCVYVVANTPFSQKVDLVPEGAPRMPDTCSPLDGSLYRSIYVDYPKSIKVVNMLNELVIFQWVDYQGKAGKYQDVVQPNGGIIRLGGYGSAPFIARTENDERVLLNGSCVLTLQNTYLNNSLIYLTAKRDERTAPVDGTFATQKFSPQVTMNIENTLDRSVKVFWLNLLGHPSWSMTVAADSTTTIYTSVSSPWIARVAGSRQRLLLNGRSILRISDSRKVETVTIRDENSPYCPKADGALRSKSGNNPVKLYITNTLSYSVNMYWYDYSGNMKKALYIPGNNYTSWMSTAASHPLSVKSWFSGEQLLINGSCFFTVRNDADVQWIEVTDKTRDIGCPSIANRQTKSTGSSSQTTKFNVTNNANTPVNLVWMSFDGTDAYTKMIPTDATELIPSWVNHTWIATSVYSNQRFTLGTAEGGARCSYSPTGSNNQNVIINAEDVKPV
ncbi:unnamed protein product [Owenia fusiformis]|uniref:Uncharacterized protein n=1 Tax=Owenia fusiformis TaxID=6347 RepID=A0A8J1UNI9_OWEFU|nr:unnamed protein product [Owenia fusiformis]